MFHKVTLTHKVLILTILTCAVLSAALGHQHQGTARDGFTRLLADHGATTLELFAAKLTGQPENAAVVFEREATGNIRSLVWQSDTEFADSDFAKLTAGPLAGQAIVHLREPQGSFRRTGRTQGASAPSLLPDELRADLIAGSPVTLRAMHEDQPYQSRFIPVSNPAGEVIGAVEVALPFAGPDATLASITRQTLVTSLLGIGVAIVAVLVLIPPSLRPIRDLEATLRKFVAGDHDVSVPHLELAGPIGAMARSLRDHGPKLVEEVRSSDISASEKAGANHELSGAMQTLAVAFDRLADGDLSHGIGADIGHALPEDHDALRQSHSRLVDRLERIFGEITDISEGVRTGASEIDQASGDLSARAETQAATLEQSAAALNQLTESVRATSERAGQAEDAGRSNRDQAENGAQVVREAIEAMKSIERSSQNVTRIIGVIDDIAFQTNLLALNAGVEAARAGEAGKGFAVVASEVRGLAQRASESAREIKALISESSSQVESGSKLVSLTGERLEDILARASEVQGLMSEIAGAAQEQSRGLNEINTGINELDKVTQQNAAVAEQTNAAAASLSQKAAELLNALGQFRRRPASPADITSQSTARNDPRERSGGARAPAQEEVILLPNRREAPERADQTYIAPEGNWAEAAHAARLVGGNGRKTGTDDADWSDF